MPIKTTKKHFEYFKKCCLVHITKLGLLDWKTYFLHEHTEDCYATTHVNIEGRVASIRLGTNWDDNRPLNNITLNETAKHEVHHLLLARLATLAHYRYIRRDELREAEEEIIRVLDRVL